jgi:hypothetical protein
MHNTAAKETPLSPALLCCCRCVQQSRQPHLQQEEGDASCLQLGLQLPQALQHKHKLTRPTAQELSHLRQQCPHVFSMDTQLVAACLQLAAAAAPALMSYAVAAQGRQGPVAVVQTDSIWLQITHGLLCCAVSYKVTATAAC